MNISKWPRGSEWRKWDLHVHTPESILNNNFGKDWDMYFKTVIEKAIEKDIAVIGITDYFCIEGYKKFMDRFLDPDMKNKFFANKNEEFIEKIDKLTIFPNIEFRISKIVGKKRLNLHVIFSEKISIADINNLFLNELKFLFQSNRESGDDKRTLTIENIKSLGKKLKKEHSNFNESDLYIGMKSLFIDDGIIQETLIKKKEFKNKYVIVLAEEGLSLMDWDGQDHNIRKTLLQKSNAIFSSNKKTRDWCLGLKHKNQQEFISEFKSLKPCFWGSDAHSYSSLFMPAEQRQLWIKADPTFAGLQQVINEPSERCFIGELPDELKKLYNNKTKYIKGIKIYKTSGSTLEEKWFESIELKLNSGLVSIIGNKGQGKSALADIIAVTSGSRKSQSFSFLCKEKFRDDNQKKAKNFEAIVIWRDNKTTGPCNLSDNPDKSNSELVNYLPQRYIENLCSEEKSTEEFKNELEEVIYSYIPEEERFEKRSLKELIDYNVLELNKLIEQKKENIKSITKEITKLEEKNSENYKTEIQNEKKEKERELESLNKSKPEEVAEPKANDKDDDKKEKINAKNKEVIELDEKIKKARNSLAQKNEDKKSISDIFLEIEDLENKYNNFVSETKKVFDKFDIKAEEVISITINKNKINLIQDKLKMEIEDLKRKIDKDDNQSLEIKKEKLLNEIKELSEKLDEPNIKYQKYLEALQKWEKNKKGIIGDSKATNTLEYFKNEIEKIKNIPKKIKEKEEKRYKYVEEIYELKKKILEIYKELYKPLKDVCEKNKKVKKEISLDFKVNLSIKDFSKKFFSIVGHNKVGSFYERENGKKVLNNLIRKRNFQEFAETKEFISEIIKYLKYDMRNEKEIENSIKSQIKEGHEINELLVFLFNLDYLNPTYSITMDGKNLETLSPGEKGCVLLVFYLLLDKSNIPLIIDQPEDNLDNETIFKFLVWCIKEAKKRRQIIIVTHNPNLAVVCDSEQIIYANIDKKDGNKVTYTSGSIEEPNINKKIIDILEGTRPAFDNRDLKYRISDNK